MPKRLRHLPSDKNNFGPRIGFAYDLTGDGKTSLRGGYGIYFGRIINATIYNALFNTGNPAGRTIHHRHLLRSAIRLTGTVQVQNPCAPIFPNVLAADGINRRATTPAEARFSILPEKFSSAAY
ncbi:MAG: hypothetical protein WKF71_11780 [Pyrinomonadaceae bacterium]